MSTGLCVYDKSHKAVPAKYLEIKSRLIRDPAGNPYIVPADFDWNTYIGKFEAFRQSLEARANAEPGLAGEGSRAMQDTAETYKFLVDQFRAAWPGSPSDIQRTYNGYTGRKDSDFVLDFRPAASFLFGAACAASGLGQIDALLGGGAQNIASWWVGGKVRISLSEFLNNPENVRHIKNGCGLYANGVAPSERASRKSKASTDQYDRPAPVPVNKPPVPTDPARPRSSLEAPQSPFHAASFPVDAQGPTAHMAGGNKFFSSSPSLD